MGQKICIIFFHDLVGVCYYNEHETGFIFVKKFENTILFLSQSCARSYNWENEWSSIYTKVPLEIPLVKALKHGGSKQTMDSYGPNPMEIYRTGILYLKSKSFSFVREK